MSQESSVHQRLKIIATHKLGRILWAEPLSRHCSWRIGGPADLFVEPQSAAQVAAVVRLCAQQQLPLVVIGQGSNLLFDDAGVRGVVMKIGTPLSQVAVSGETIEAGAGAWVPGLARTCMRNGLSGLEHCIGIPGTLGGLVMMNGGSQRKGIGDNVVSVTVVSARGELQQLSREQCEFSYRHSALQSSGAIVVAAQLHCDAGDKKEIRRAMLNDLRERRGKFPRKQPNCGSVFLSSAAMHASVGPPGKIIEQAGLKGTRIGDAEVSQQHANFILNKGGASSADVLALIAHIRQRVQRQIDFELCCEVRYVSPEGVLMPAHKRAASL